MAERAGLLLLRRPAGGYVRPRRAVFESLTWAQPRAANQAQSALPRTVRRLSSLPLPPPCCVETAMERFLSPNNRNQKRAPVLPSAADSRQLLFPPPCHAPAPTITAQDDRPPAPDTCDRNATRKILHNVRILRRAGTFIILLVRRFPPRRPGSLNRPSLFFLLGAFLPQSAP